MEFEINHTLYPIKIQRKKNKNTYIRIHENLEIFVTTSIFTTNKQIYNLLDENRSSISQMIRRKKKELEKENAKLDKIYDFLDSGIYNKEEFISRSKTIKNNIESLESKLKEYNSLLQKTIEIQ